ncbi:UDP-glucose/GDP-mannose dehydrogenase family protein [candidate division KSB1 bacterium]|nr:UDP-glucose/GDP-mannose dehydrogenase family protein [candidate division KSB1 bacterium]RQW01556.1 MAG: UDP-glucose/GDP-mannose dehydrogenase family protein [candidate division KSB1 bacterium]
MNIGVVGMGYVGCVSAACFAEMGHTVLGVDTNAAKIRLLARGISPIVEDRLSDIIAEQVLSGRLAVTTVLDHAVQQSDILFIAVGTPSHADGSLDFQQVEQVCLNIGAALKVKEEYVSIILRSTVLPGLAETVVIPLLEKYSGKKVGDGFGFALNPEFLREGNAVSDFYNPPKTVIGQVDELTGDRLQELYSSLSAPIFRIGLAESSMIKYTDNAFHALKVVFANEIGRLCKKFNIDSRIVMDVFCQDTKLNLSPIYLKPGFAFGGSCLPKDLRAITHHARQADVKVPLLESALTSNLEHIQFATDMVKKDHRTCIGILGISFKEGTDDLRESPVVDLAERLLNEGYSLSIYDENVLSARKRGANIDYLQRHTPYLDKLLADSVEEVLNKSQIVLIGNRNRAHHVVLSERSNGHHIIDLSGLNEHQHKNAEVHYEGLCW